MKNKVQNIKFRYATIDDTELILHFIKELAEYEKLANEVVTNADELKKSMFGERPAAEVIFALVDDEEVGFVLFFHNFSTFLGRSGLYIEDLFVKPGFRGIGIGKAILSYMSSLALERNCGRVEWWVLNWNPARKFYDSIGAKSMDEWVVYRLSGKELSSLADEGLQ